MKELQRLIDGAKRIVFFGGAGVSTESGIPDFRSADGLYQQKYEVPPEQLLSHSYFLVHPEEFFKFYREKMLCINAQPNAAHYKLAEWEMQGKLTAVITQNIDGLHQKAGSRTVLELHGSIYRNHCTACGKAYPVEKILSGEKIPRCSCGGILKPDVVLYEESLDFEIINEAVRQLSSADLLIVAGTSLTVYPAAGLIDYFQGGPLVLINRDKTPADGRADLVIHGNVAEILNGLD